MPEVRLTVVGAVPPPRVMSFDRLPVEGAMVREVAEPVHILRAVGTWRSGVVVMRKASVKEEPIPKTIGNVACVPAERDHIANVLAGIEKGALPPAQVLRTAKLAGLADTSV